MPELPEVEIFKRYLDATSLHQRIDDVDVRNTYILKETSARELARGLKGRRFESSRRHGKHLFVRADGEIVELALDRRLGLLLRRRAHPEP